ncbi:ribonuclease H-like domain-containing protein [Tanacetum coccineum]|uniref:Ribonuclease H-like domain-containing protein n=1 Tax=Tanacetum coccineum TaxID=301880 RepID=A0ABQ5DA04_9ASTR
MAESISHPIPLYSAQPNNLGYVYLQSGLGHYCPSPAQPASYMTHPQANLVSYVPIQPAQVQPQPAQIPIQQAHPCSSPQALSTMTQQESNWKWIWGVLISSREHRPAGVLCRCDSDWGDLYPVTPTTISYTNIALLSLSPTTWHRRLGHPSEDMLRRLESSHFISYNKTKLPALCHACQLGKHTKLPFYSSESNVGMLIGAGCPVTRNKVYPPVLVFLGDNLCLVLPQTARFLNYTRSSAEADITRCCSGMLWAETAWIRNFHQHTKHIEIDIHFVREYVASGQVRVLHVLCQIS